MNKENRFATIMVGALFASIIVEYIIDQKKVFANWQSNFFSKFQPGQREFLRDILTKEEMIVTEDCGCEDG